MNVKNIKLTPISEQEKAWGRYYRELTTKIGLLPGYWTSGGSDMKVNSEKRLSPERFSTNYKTREEFDNDRIKILEYLGRMEYAPEDLVQKVAETVEELDLQFGE